jgi:hypothetical protein
VIQGYVLAERLGIGGFGEVWKAHNPRRPGLAVALKFFTDKTARDWLVLCHNLILGYTDLSL